MYYVNALNFKNDCFKISFLILKDRCIFKKKKYRFAARLNARCSYFSEDDVNKLKRCLG
jgi:hypothetical protein